MIVEIKDDLTSHVTTSDGLLECNLPNYNPETLVPFSSREEVQAFANALTNPNYFRRKLTQEEAEAARVAKFSADQAAAWERIKAERDRRRFDGGAKVGGNWFLSTQQAVGEYSALVLMGSSFPPGAVLRPGWRTMVPGVTVDMTAALAAQILGSGFQAIAAIDDAAQAHRAAMEASDAPESYDISSSWPVSIGDAL
jgi:hypothetical protein